MLADRVRDWNQADGIRAYCDAVEARHGQSAVGEGATAALLALAREHADRLQELPVVPRDPEVRPGR